MAPTCTAAVCVSLIVLLVFAVNILLYCADICTDNDDYIRASSSHVISQYISRISSVNRCLVSSLSVDPTVPAKQSWPPAANRRLKYCKSRVSYCSNADCSFNLLLDTSRLLQISGDIELNPGPTTTTVSSSPRYLSNHEVDRQHHGDLHRQADVNGHKIKYTAAYLRDLRFQTDVTIDNTVLNR